jgi:GTPase involved in cell partitioning and DNA repair
MNENKHMIEDVREKVKEFVTANGKYRFANHAFEIIADKYDEMDEESQKKFKELGEMSSRLFAEAVDETMHDNIMSRINNTLETGRKNRARIIPVEAKNHFEKGRALWISDNDEIKRQAAQEFEKASEDPPRNSEWTKRQLMLLAAEAYGRLEMFDDELRLHKKIKEMK